MPSGEHCPVCGRNLDHFDGEGVSKHIKACKRRHLNELNPHEGRGRPKIHEHIRTPKDFP